LSVLITLTVDTRMLKIFRDLEKRQKGQCSSGGKKEYEVLKWCLLQFFLSWNCCS
jgi:hypothetical protein